MGRLSRRTDRKLALVRLQANDHIDTGDAGAIRDGWQPGEGKIVGCNIDQALFRFQIEMEMIRRVGIEIGPLAFNRHFPQQASRGELVEGVVDGGQ